jgi:hypothetical protein
MLHAISGLVAEAACTRCIQAAAEANRISSSTLFIYIYIYIHKLHECNDLLRTIMNQQTKPNQTKPNLVN